MNIQSKFDNMVEVLEKYGYRAKVVSETDWGEIFYTLVIYPENNGWLGYRFRVFYKEKGNKFYFYLALNLKDKDLARRDTELMIEFWKQAVDLCEKLNSLKIPYIKQYEGDNGLIQYMKCAYKRINKRFVITVNKE